MPPAWRARCGRDNPVPKAQAAAKADQPLTFRRQGNGWQSFQCSCGASINLSPAFQAASQTCARCGKSIEIL